MNTSARDEIFRKIAGSADIILAATAIASFAAWSYCIYSYVWPGAQQFHTAWDIVFFLCLPPAAGIFARAVLRFSAAGKVSITLIWSSTVGAIYALEMIFALSLLGNRGSATATETDKHERRQLAAISGVKYDNREMIEVLADAKMRGIDAVPAVYPAALLEPQPGGALRSAIRIKNIKALPLGGVSNKLSVLCNDERRVYGLPERRTRIS